MKFNMQKSILTTFLFVLFLSPLAKANPPIDKKYKIIFNKAEEYFVNENYPAALILYLRLDSIEKANANINFKIGMSYLNSATYKTKSIPYLEAASKDVSEKFKELTVKETHAPLSTYFYLAKAYHLNYEFDKAIEMYGKYKAILETNKKNADEVEEMNHCIETCNYGKELVKTKKNVIVKNLGDGVNTKYPEYSPVVSLDEETLIFTSRRKGGTTDDILPNGQYYEDILISKYKDEKWGQAVSIGSNINTYGHEASINISADGTKLLIYKDDNGNGNIYESELKGSEWGNPKYEMTPVNSDSWETHACYSSDNRILYFASDRPGGYGGRDIYKCLKLPNGKWGPAQNLGDTINTKYDEDDVFIHPDGKQIFFSSKGHNSMGGFDIFTSLIDNENGFWSTPINYGYPVNTTDDDVFLITSPDGRRAFFSSDQEGGYGEKDIYMIQFPDYEPRDITILVGRILNNSSEDITDNRIYIINTSKGDTVQVLNANSSTGKFGANLPVGDSYKTNYYVNGKQFFSEVLVAPRNVGYRALKRNVPYNGKHTVDEVMITNTPEPEKIDTIKVVDRSKKVERNFVVDTTQIIDVAPVVKNMPATAVAKQVVEPVKPLVEEGKNPKEVPQASANKCDMTKTSYQLNFKYNRKEIDSNSDEFRNFIDEINYCLQSNSSFKIEIESSASNVPTKTYKTNDNLANVRAKAAHNKVLIALLKKGFKESQLNFVEPKSMVQGPEYKKDAKRNKSTYEQFQYIKINLSVINN